MWQFLTVRAANSGAVLQILSSLYLIVCCSILISYVSGPVTSGVKAKIKYFGAFKLFAVWIMGSTPVHAPTFYNLKDTLSNRTSSEVRAVDPC